MASSLGSSCVCHTLELSVILLLTGYVRDQATLWDGEFSFGLERVLDGIETLIENRRTGHG